MFELSIALKYLIPKKKSLSTALISLMSVVVISLVIWLVLIFLSVTAGIEKNWLQKLTSLHAPIRITPTKTYYDSYFYQIDTLTASSGYTAKTIGEKKDAFLSDPYSPLVDAELPTYIPSPEKTLSGTLKDPVKELFSLLEDLQKEIPQLKFQDYEITGALMRISLQQSNAFLSQMTYLLSIPTENPNIGSLLIPTDQGSIHLDSPPSTPPSYAYFVNQKLYLPEMKETVSAILPKSYKDSGAKLLDRGTLSYMTSTLTSFQEQKIPFQVVGFYDPGIMAIGNKCILIPQEVTRDIYTATQTFSPDGTPTNGVFVWLENLSETHRVQEKILRKIQDKGLSSYWNVTNYENFEFSKDLLQQFRSDRMLLLLIATIILVVACSNIISLLVLLVNDKKKEIAILQSMGASFKSIALIFGICGTFLGLISCIFGSILAFFTLKHLETLVSFLSLIQGRSAFHPSFFGQNLPNEFSMTALLFVIIITPILSLIAGLIPAIKASRIRPSIILRSE